MTSARRSRQRFSRRRERSSRTRTGPRNGALPIRADPLSYMAGTGIRAFWASSQASLRSSTEDLLLFLLMTRPNPAAQRDPEGLSANSIFSSALREYPTSWLISEDTRRLPACSSERKAWEPSWKLWKPKQKDHRREAAAAASGEDSDNSIEVECELLPSAVNFDSYTNVCKFRPFGIGNAKPNFVTGIS